MKLELISDMIQENGKTIKQNNLEIKHKIPIGSLVEIIPWDVESSKEFNGIRLHVFSHNRDCDGSPLYTLNVQNLRLGGFTEDIIKEIK